MYGLNQGEVVEKIAVPAEAQRLADAGDFDVSISKFNAGPDGQLITH